MAKAGSCRELLAMFRSFSNGYLAGNTLEELLEVYMGDLAGDEVYENFGNEFPLLIKFIDANDDLSIQVHPDDEMAAERPQLVR